MIVASPIPSPKHYFHSFCLHQQTGGRNQLAKENSFNLAENEITLCRYQALGKVHRKLLIG